MKQWIRRQDCAWPSMAGARSRQLSLSEIVPDDFVEPGLSRSKRDVLPLDDA